MNQELNSQDKKGWPMWVKYQAQFASLQTKRSVTRVAAN